MNARKPDFGETGLSASEAGYLIKDHELMPVNQSAKDVQLFGSLHSFALDASNAPVAYVAPRPKLVFADPDYVSIVRRKAGLCGNDD